MKIIQGSIFSFFFGMAAFIALSGASAGTLVIDTNEPTGPNTPIYSAPHDVNLPGLVEVGNGQTFITSTAFDLARITLVKASSQGYGAGSMLRLNIFAWNPTTDANDVSSWGSGNGTADGDPLNDTGMTSLFSQDFDLTGLTIGEHEFIHFNLDTTIPLATNTAYGFTSEFIYGGSGVGNINYRYDRGIGGDVFAGGTFIATTTSANNNTANRNMAFYLSDVAAVVVEPPAPLGSVSMGQLEPLEGSALISNPQQNTSVRVDAAGESFGESFVTTSAFDLRSITIMKHNWTSYKAGNKLRLKVFAWNPTTDANNSSEWVKGDGAGDEDPLNGTGMTIVYDHDLVMPAMIIDTGSYIYLDLGTNVALTANTAYGFTIEFIYGGSGPTHFICKAFQDDAIYPDGKQIGTTPTANSVGPDELTFYLGDTLVATEVEVDILSHEFSAADVIKVTVSTLYPSSCYPRTRSELNGKDGWWKGLAHSTNGAEPFIETNLNYSATDATGSNYVVYVQATNDTGFVTVGSKAIGNFEQRIHDNGTDTMPYRMLKPDEYDPTVKYPLVIGFHGAGGGGTDNTSRSIEAMGHLSTAEMRKDYPAFVITPQATSNWADTSWALGSYSIDEIAITKWMIMVYEVIDDLELEYNIDTNRIYVTGQSMGGFGAYDCVMRDPERFAALVPMAGGGDPTQATNMMNVAIWSFHGALDTVVPVEGDREMAAALTAAGHTNWTYTEYPDAGHAVTVPAWGNTNLIPWIFQQVK